MLREITGRVTGSRVVLLVGAGDNGGDALYGGARLAARGARVDALLVADRHHVAGADALRRQAAGQTARATCYLPCRRSRRRRDPARRRAASRPHGSLPARDDARPAVPPSGATPTPARH
jgi:hypothetical protein